MALDGGAGDDSFFVDEDISACLNTAISLLANVVVF